MADFQILSMGINSNMTEVEAERIYPLAKNNTIPLSGM